ncbi:MAG: division/cell wall cluster transcriptional repressor MraZ [Bacteroidaceae bacterium]|nr:division/cell wall cluster transcriptional repressor MraZ [Bacteroidaceae bacterium]
MRFTGNIDAKTDEKGRVFVPATFRKLLQQANLDSLILRKDIFQQCLVLYPENVWDAMVDAIAERTNPFDSKGRAAMRGFVAGAERISIDGNGRILIPRRYLESADIQGEVRFIGMDDSIEIWNRQKAESLLDTPDSLAESLELLMNNENHE